MELRNDFKGRDFISLNDYSPEDLLYMLDVADELKRLSKLGKCPQLLAGKTLGMIFQKSSTRTRVSFESGIYRLGGVGMFLSANDLQMGRGEPIKDTARVLSRYLDGLMIRTYSHDEVLELAYYADMPIINGLTDLLHPCQALADMQTAREYKGTLANLKLAFIGDGNNVAHSLINASAKFGMHFTIACPQGHTPNESVLAEAQKSAQLTGGTINIVADPAEATKDADIVYTDVWASMGQESEAEERKKAFQKYQVNQEFMQYAKPDAIVMHCLPAKRGMEITDEVIEGKQSVVFDEAENRMWAQMAIMALLMA